LDGDVIAIPPAGPVVVGDVTRRLLEIGHETAPLEHLGQDVRRALARQVYPAELRDGIVTVLDEHTLEELLGSSGRGVAVRSTVAGGVETSRAQELVEEKPAKRLGRARVAGEESTLHDLGQVDQREHGTIEVGEIGSEGGLLLAGELFGHPARS